MSQKPESAQEMHQLGFENPGNASVSCGTISEMEPPWTESIRGVHATSIGLKSYSGSAAPETSVIIASTRRLSWPTSEVGEVGRT